MNQSKDAEDDGSGCVFIIGLVIVAIVVGHIYTQLAGWLVIGVGLMIAAMLSAERRRS